MTTKCGLQAIDSSAINIFVLLDSNGKDKIIG